MFNNDETLRMFTDSKNISNLYVNTGKKVYLLTYNLSHFNLY